MMVVVVEFSSILYSITIHLLVIVDASNTPLIDSSYPESFVSLLHYAEYCGAATIPSSLEIYESSLSFFV
jgi:hypothetical protein